MSVCKQSNTGSQALEKYFNRFFGQSFIPTMASTSDVAKAMSFILYYAVKEQVISLEALMLCFARTKPAESIYLTTTFTILRFFNDTVTWNALCSGDMTFKAKNTPKPVVFAVTLCHAVSDLPTLDSEVPIEEFGIKIPLIHCLSSFFSWMLNDVRLTAIFKDAFKLDRPLVSKIRSIVLLLCDYTKPPSEGQAMEMQHLLEMSSLTNIRLIALYLEALFAEKKETELPNLKSSISSTIVAQIIDNLGSGRFDVLWRLYDVIGMPFAVCLATELVVWFSSNDGSVSSDQKNVTMAVLSLALDQEMSVLEFIKDPKRPIELLCDTLKTNFSESLFDLAVLIADKVAQTQNNVALSSTRYFGC